MATQSFDSMLPSDMLSCPDTTDILDAFDDLNSGSHLGPYSGENSAFDTSMPIAVPALVVQGKKSKPGVRSTNALSSAERKLLSNRTSQKRLRDRRKARMQSTEAQLADTASELQTLKARQKHLEARNALLEKVADLRKQTASHQALALPWQVLPNVWIAADSLSAQPTIIWHQGRNVILALLRTQR